MKISYLSLLAYVMIRNLRAPDYMRARKRLDEPASGAAVLHPTTIQTIGATT
jgi:hypothetical protein